ncbi:hypothetical protein [Sphingopyxis sp.]|uniref:hypothetical protein n=1 Tax=Sphingopyxis sp. TaxID=1908224 RepID=UPI002589353D|nr:hypothetical protein [Sphingopyxis sp.]
MLEDFVLRENICHFDHEPIPERIASPPILQEQPFSPSSPLIDRNCWITPPVLTDYLRVCAHNNQSRR